jgi:amidohydrolase
MPDDLKQDVEKIREQLVEWRRDFHRFPEVAFQEHRTSKRIKSLLQSMGISAAPCAKTGLRAVLEGAAPGKTVALRADIDALPLQEQGEKEYISQNPGAAHACAHDGHMAVVLGAARILAGRKDRWKGRVAFLFQPSEERIPGGAKLMIEEGALEDVEAVFGLHFWQPMPTGKIGLVKGPMMAQPDAFTIKVKGRGGHGSMPHQAEDTILAASQIVVSAQSIVSRNVDPLKPCVVSFGTVNGGSIYNIMPAEVVLTGTVRTFDPGLKSMVEGRLRKIVNRTSQAFGCRAELKYENGYPPLVNDPAMAEFVLDKAHSILGEDCVMDIDPVMGGEDFSYFLQKVPGAFLFFGMGDGMDFPHHHPEFDMDEKALAPACQLMTGIALDFLDS